MAKKRNRKGMVVNGIKFEAPMMSEISPNDMLPKPLSEDDSKSLASLAVWAGLFALKYWALGWLIEFFIPTADIPWYVKALIVFVL